ncbi:MAG: hypothetical protein ACRCW1_00625 [Anaerotignaceae bacterium]
MRKELSKIEVTTYTHENKLYLSVDIDGVYFSACQANRHDIIDMTRGILSVTDYSFTYIYNMLSAYEEQNISENKDTPKTKIIKTYRKKDVLELANIIDLKGYWAPEVKEWLHTHLINTGYDIHLNRRVEHGAKYYAKYREYVVIK